MICPTTVSLDCSSKQLFIALYSKRNKSDTCFCCQFHLRKMVQDSVRTSAEKVTGQQNLYPNFYSRTPDFLQVVTVTCRSLTLAGLKIGTGQQDRWWFKLVLVRQKSYFALQTVS